jgi:gamma-glutamyltranspeptidase/glutathione hydrolase
VSKVAVATTSQLAADAAREVADAGGNAVDCALAAALLTINTEPGVCALGGSAFITIWSADTDPVTIDGNVAVPGKGLSDTERKHGAVEITVDYGGGITTLVGPGSVSVPGTLAAMEDAWQNYGRVPWRVIFEPTIRACRQGFPLSAACRYYLGYSGDIIFGRSDDGHKALHREDGTLIDAGDTVHIPHLADTLDGIATEGARLFYEGDIARAIADHCRAGDGMLTADLDIDRWDSTSLSRLIESQRAGLDFRQRNLDLAEDVGPEAARMVEAARNGQLLSRWASASTVHTSVVDDSGNGCAITASSGYGSGEMPAGTGLWLNNCLGEIELNRRGLDAGPPGARLPSNMTPAVARRDGAVLAVGSPGADRITTAMQQFLINYMQLGMPLADAIAHPRVHVDTSGDEIQLKAEPGLDLPEVDLPVTVFPELVMYFGGVGAAVFDDNDGFAVAADPRREGGIYNPAA